MNETAVPVPGARAQVAIAEPVGALAHPAADRAAPSPGRVPAEPLDAQWAEEADFLAELTVRRAQMARSALDGGEAVMPARSFPGVPGWLARVESLLDRLLPGHLGSLLQLFICVSLTMAMISAMLPLVDRF